MKLRLALLVSSALGAGYAPRAPGTMGSLVALPLAAWTLGLSLEFRVVFWVALFLLGTWAAQLTDEHYQTGDNQRIVIDEVMGIGITSWLALPEWRELALVFILFRFFDITKIPPVRQLDQWSKKLQKKAPHGYWRGFGVMVDDVVAAFQALFCFYFLRLWFF